MDRHVHHELRSAITALTVAAICAPLTVNVHGTLFGPGGLHLFLAGLIGFPVLLTLLQATRIKWIGEIGDFETAVALPEPPAEKSLLRHPLNPWLFAMMTPVTLGLAFAWEPATALLPLWPALAWLGRAWLAAEWERRHHKTLWRGHNPEKPWRLSLTPRPLTRTATDALPE
ncbi:hypothetical protein AB0I00_06290 [Streptomyces sp. NPDC050803]|uniref:hypothetical protein n=1 Tax=unclassified Streptomyces TaxID=2593676 RepID=UPI0034469CB9